MIKNLFLQCGDLRCLVNAVNFDQSQAKCLWYGLHSLINIMSYNVIRNNGKVL